MKIKKINSHELTKQGLCLKSKKQDVHLSFSKLNKIYIQKRKFNRNQKIALLAVFALLFRSSLSIVTSELALILSLLYIPAFVTFQEFKWYRLCIIDKNDTLYFKVFYSESKELLIREVVSVRKGIFENLHSKPKQNIEIHNSAAIHDVDECTLQLLSIA